MKIYLGDTEIKGVESWEIDTAFPGLSDTINEMAWVSGPDKMIAFLKSKLVEIEDYKKQIQGKVEEVMEEQE